jgi:predicted nuclease with TOPRIM domain
MANYTDNQKEIIARVINDDSIINETDEKKINSAVTSKLENNEEKISQLEREKSQLVSENSKLEGEKSQLVSEKSQLEGEKSQLVSENSKLEGEKSQLVSENSKLEGEKSQLVSEKSQLEQQLNTCNETKLDELRKINQELSKKTTELETEKNRYAIKESEYNKLLADISGNTPKEIIDLKTNINSISNEMTTIMDKVSTDTKNNFINTYFTTDISGILKPKISKINIGNKTSDISNLIFASQGQLVPSNVEVNITTPASSTNSSTVNAKITYSKQNIAYVESLTTSVSDTISKTKADDHLP